MNGMRTASLQVQELRHELLQYKAGEVLPSAAAVALTGGDRRELDELRERTTQLEANNMKLQTRLAEAVADRARIFSQMASLEDSRDRLNQVIDNVRRIIEYVAPTDSSFSNDCGCSEKRRNRPRRRVCLRSSVSGSSVCCSRLSTYCRRTRRSRATWTTARSISLKYIRMSHTERFFLSYHCPFQKEDDTDGDDTEMDEQFPSRFVEVQSALSREMEDLLSQIREKERLIEQTAANHELMNKMRAQHEVCA